MKSETTPGCPMPDDVCADCGYRCAPKKQRVIELTEQESARVIDTLGRALASPTRDDGSSKRGFRRG